MIDLVIVWWISRWIWRWTRNETDRLSGAIYNCIRWFQWFDRHVTWIDMLSIMCATAAELRLNLRTACYIYTASEFAFFCALVVHRKFYCSCSISRAFSRGLFLEAFSCTCPLSYCCPIKFHLCLGHFCGSWIYNPSLTLLFHTANMIDKRQKWDRVININITVLSGFGLFNHLFIQSIHIIHSNHPLIMLQTIISFNNLFHTINSFILESSMLNIALYQGIA